MSDGSAWCAAQASRLGLRGSSSGSEKAARRRQRATNVAIPFSHTARSPRARALSKAGEAPDGAGSPTRSGGRESLRSKIHGSPSPRASSRPKSRPTSPRSRSRGPTSGAGASRRSPSVGRPSPSREERRSRRSSVAGDAASVASTRMLDEELARSAERSQAAMIADRAAVVAAEAEATAAREQAAATSMELSRVKDAMTEMTDTVSSCNGQPSRRFQVLAQL